MSVKVYYDQDASMSALEGKRIAVIGYGAQGRAQARMFYESGIDTVVGLRKGGKSWELAMEDGIPVMTIEEAAASGDIVHMLIPDEYQKEVYEASIKDNLEPGNILSFSHGFNIVFGRINPPDSIGVTMMAPKAPGTEVYKCFRQGFGVPSIISVYRNNKENNARDIALAMAKATRGTKAGVMECTFEQEAYEDLFGEQAVLCGGSAELIKAGFETLIEAGYPPELAYFECLHELKLIVDLIYDGGLEKMWEVVSNTAEYGGHTRGTRVITPAVKAEMKKILQEVEDGTFAKEWMDEYEIHGMKNLLEMRRKEGEHPVEIVGRKIRKMFDKDGK